MAEFNIEMLVDAGIGEEEIDGGRNPKKFRETIEVKFRNFINFVVLCYMWLPMELTFISLMSSPLELKISNT